MCDKEWFYFIHLFIYFWHYSTCLNYNNFLPLKFLLSMKRPSYISTILIYDHSKNTNLYLKKSKNEIVNIK